MYLMKLRSVWSLALLTLFLGSFASLQAAPTTKQNANKVVSAWLKQSARPLNAKMQDEILSIDTYKDDAGTVLYYIVNLDPEGYVVIAGDDLVEPVIAFSQSGKHDPVPKNPMYTLLQGDLPGRIKYVKDLQKEAKENNKLFTAKGASLKAKTKWTQLLNAPELQESDAIYYMAGIGSVDDLRVPPLVQTKWAQGNVTNDSIEVACYNYYTPSGPGSWPEGDSGNIVCGCVATAMAQLMRFHQYPTDGVGTNAYQVYVDGNEFHALRGGDGSGGAYDWANMALDPNSSSTQIQRIAIGSLCADASVSVRTVYSSGGSGTYSTYIAPAFKETFKYDNAIFGYNTNEELVGTGFIEMANPNLDAGYPVLLGITGSGGHSVICDGYGYNNSTLYHHVNMGWAGLDDAWYALPDIANFDKVLDCIYNVFPSGTGEIISGRVLDGAGNPVDGFTITANDGSTKYPGTTNDKGIYAIRVPSDTSFRLTCPGATGKNVVTGASIGPGTTVGNLWAQDFSIVSGANLTYSTTSFLESTANNGSIYNSIIITLVDDTFTGTNGTDVAGKVGVTNLPSGLTAVFTKNSNMQLTVTLADTAGSHTDADDISNLTFTFLNSAFGSGDASSVFQYSKSDLVIDFDIPVVFYFKNLDLNPGWTTSGDWAYGIPTGNSEAFGPPDPEAGYTGDNVYGYNLNGGYAHITSTNYLTTGAINCSSRENVTFSFRRWLGVGVFTIPRDNANIEIFNGTVWTEIWAKSSKVEDEHWLKVEYGISADADDNPALQIRWGMGTTDDSLNSCGWNIDDVTLTGISIGPAGPSDVDDDGMPDDWETTYGLNVGANDADADADNDSMSNYEEYISGTNPTNASSLLRLENVDFQAGASNIVLEWQSATGRHYSIIGCTNLVNLSWDVLHDNIPATPSTNEFTINADGKPHYYRIRVEQ